jgi:raffinose/stachyose/melibiose transport system substrate-binding protein
MSKKSSLRRWTGLLVVAMILSLLAACGGGNKGGNASGEASNTAGSASPSASVDASAPSASANADSEIKGEITWATHRVDQVDTTFKKYVEKFKAKYPGITDVKIEGIKDYEKTMRVRMAANEFPDVMNLIVTTPSDYPNYYEPLDSIGWNDRLYFTEFTSFDGKLYGISQQAAVNGLVYNKKAFAAAGVTAPPKTVDELYAISEKLKAKGITPMATAYKDAWTLQYWEHPSEFIYGSNTLRNDNLKTETPFMVDNAYGKGLSILKTLYDKGYLEKDIYSAGYDQTVKDMAAGKIGMMYIGNWLASYLVDNGLAAEDVGFAPLPHDNSGKLYGSLQNDWAYAVSKNSKNKPAAIAFVKFMIEESGDFEDHGIMSPLKDVKSTLPMLQEFMSYNPEMMENKPRDPALIEIENKMQFNYTDLAQEAIVAKDMQSVFDEYNKKWQAAKKAVGK